MNVKKMLLIASSGSRAESSDILVMMIICKIDSIFSISSVQKLPDSSFVCIIIIFTSLYAMPPVLDYPLRFPTLRTPLALLRLRPAFSATLRLVHFESPGVTLTPHPTRLD